MQNKKTKLVGFQTDEEMHARVVATAKAEGFDTYADWMRNLVSAALSGAEKKPAGFEPFVLNKLASVYGGYFAPTLTRQLEGEYIDQPLLLHSLLRDLCEIAASGHTLRSVHVAPDECISRNPIPSSERAYPETVRFRFSPERAQRQETEAIAIFRAEFDRATAGQSAIYPEPSPREAAVAEVSYRKPGEDTPTRIQIKKTTKATP